MSLTNESSLTRMLAVLELFKGTQNAWTVDAIAQTLGYTVPTAYRYVRELTDAGLLRGASGATFVIGPAVIELDYQIRLHDPLIAAARGPMRRLAEQTDCDVVLGTIYGSRIVTVHHEFGDEQIRPSFGRGRQMPLFKGAMSQCVLSALARAQLRKLYDTDTAAAAQDSAPPRDWEAVLEDVKRVRREGHAITHGELDDGLVGIAVPFADAEHKIVAALGFILSKERFTTTEVPRAVQMLSDCCGEMAWALRGRSSAEQRRG